MRGGFVAGHGGKLRQHRLETIRNRSVAVAAASGRSRQPLSMERVIQSSGELRSCIHQTLVIAKMVKRLLMNQVVLYG